ncbi:hypothetical protein V8F20_001342 [Naviculisporaceae sp. PSN 640]
MSQSRQFSTQLSQFEQEIIDDHSGAELDGSNFEVLSEEISNPRASNCIAYAIGVTDRWLNPFTIDELTLEYNLNHYFSIPVTTPLLPGDVEVYVNSDNEPKHAHRIVSISEGGIAQSKMGPGPVIKHPRGMLDTPIRSQPGRYRYGRISLLFRRDDEEYIKWFEAHFTVTSSGRIIKKSQARPSYSGRRIVEKTIKKRRSNKNKPRSGKSGKRPKNSRAAALVEPEFSTGASESGSRNRDGYETGDSYHQSSQGTSGPEGQKKKPQPDVKKQNKLGWCIACLGWLFKRRPTTATEAT